MSLIRIENCDSPEDRAAIWEVNRAAFGGADEADLVDHLRADGHVLVSIVAELGPRIVGHCLFSRMWIDTPSGRVSAVALAPVAVLPEYQRQGFGSQLIRRGLELLRGQNEKIVVVVGHPAYYPKFGFSTRSAESLESPFPRDAFMALELTAGALAGIRGPVVYPSAFGI